MGIEGIGHEEEENCNILYGSLVGPLAAAETDDDGCQQLTRGADCAFRTCRARSAAFPVTSVVLYRA